MRFRCDNRARLELTLLVLSHRATAIIDQALRVDKPNTTTSFFNAHTLQREEAHKLHRNTDTSRPSTQEKDALVYKRRLRRSRGEFSCVDETREHDSASALNVIVEDRVTVAEGLEVLEGVLSRKVLSANVSKRALREGKIC